MPDCAERTDQSMNSSPPKSSAEARGESLLGFWATMMFWGIKKAFALGLLIGAVLLGRRASTELFGIEPQDARAILGTAAIQAVFIGIAITLLLALFRSRRISGARRYLIGVLATAGWWTFSLRPHADEIGTSEFLLEVVSWALAILAVIALYRVDLMLKRGQIQDRMQRGVPHA